MAPTFAEASTEEDSWKVKRIRNTAHHRSATYVGGPRVSRSEQGQ
jgi:hypothetical protein